MADKATRLLAAAALFVVLLSAAVEVSAQSQGLELSLDRDVTSQRGQGETGRLTCQASGNAVTVERVAVIWVNATGEVTELLTVTTRSPSGSVSRDGIVGNGTLENNSAYIVLDQTDAALCGSSQEYFLCEATFTGPTGESERAVATAWPRRQPQSAKPGVDMDGSNHTQGGLPSLERRLEDMSAALEMMNMSFTSLMAGRQQEQMERAKILSRLDTLENQTSSPSGPRTCDACSNVSQALDNLEKRLEDLEMLNMPSDGGGQQGPVCESGMNETTSEPFVLLTHDALGREIRCDAQSDGGGWIVFQRRSKGDVDFNKTWAEYRDGFGNLETDFWLGNEALYKLTNQHSYELRVDVRTDAGNDLYNTYSSFKVEDESNLFRLRLGPFSGGTLGEVNNGGLAPNRDMAFSTVDRDNDLFPDGHCASSPRYGAFWQNQCSSVGPNARWGRTSWFNGQELLNLVFIEMKIRRLDSILP